MENRLYTRWNGYQSADAVDVRWNLTVNQSGLSTSKESLISSTNIIIWRHSAEAVDKCE